MSTELSSAAPHETVLEVIRAELEDAGVDLDTMAPEAKIDDLIDSLDISQLLTTIDQRFGVMIPRPELAEITVDGLVAKVVASAGS